MNAYSCNAIAEKLGKDPLEFTKADIIKYVMDEGIRHINFQ